MRGVSRGRKDHTLREQPLVALHPSAPTPSLHSPSVSAIQACLVEAPPPPGRGPAPRPVAPVKRAAALAPPPPPPPSLAAGITATFSSLSFQKRSNASGHRPCGAHVHATSGNHNTKVTALQLFNSKNCMYSAAVNLHRVGAHPAVTRTFPRHRTTCTAQTIGPSLHDTPGICTHA